MNVGRRFDALLSRELVLELLQLMGARRWVNEQEIRRDFCASHPGTHARVQGTIALLKELDIVKARDNVFLFAQHEVDEPRDWIPLIRERIAYWFAAEIGRASAIRCVSADVSVQGLLLDSFLVPLTFGQTPFWALEFSVVTRETPESRHWKIDGEFSSLFLDVVRKANQAFKIGRLRSETLAASLERDAKNGLIAEEWVVEREKQRLRGHPLVDQVRRISDETVDAGFDICSFSNATSVVYDRFIEVKSYGSVKRFFWSRNEIDTARQLEDSYFLYLVDRSKIDETSYAPQAIQGPYFSMIESQLEGWLMEPVAYEFIAKV